MKPLQLGSANAQLHVARFGESIGRSVAELRCAACAMRPPARGAHCGNQVEAGEDRVE
jgi:hypothetical protein